MLWLCTAVILQLTAICGTGFAVGRISQQALLCFQWFVHSQRWRRWLRVVLLQIFLWRHPSKKNTPFLETTLFGSLLTLVNRVSTPSSYLISTTLSVGLVWAPDLSSSVSWAFLATFGLQLAFLLIWGLCPLRCIWGLLEPSFRLGSGLLEPFVLGCCRPSRVLSGTSPRSPQ